MKNSPDLSGYLIIVGLIALAYGGSLAGTVIPAAQSDGLDGTVYIRYGKGNNGESSPIKKQLAYVVLLCGGGFASLSFGVYKAWTYKGT